MYHKQLGRRELCMAGVFDDVEETPFEEVGTSKTITGGYRFQTAHFRMLSSK